MLNFRAFETPDVMNIELDYELSGESRMGLVSHDNIVGYTLLDGDTILAVGGLHMMWFGVGEAWLLVSPKALDKPVALARYSNKLLHGIVEKTQVRRVQASVHTHDTRAMIFAEWLGFEHEGIMRKYGLEGDDYFRMARIEQ